jgi:hypothetical protein
MVLVDQYGVPRVRCECGNPLTPPRPVQKTPRYTGPRWKGFNPTTIIVIQQTTVIINTFVLIDVFTGNPFERPRGTEGGEDVVHEAKAWHLEVTLPFSDGTAIKWSLDVTRNADGTLTGKGSGTWHCKGYTYENVDSNRTGTFTVDVAFPVTISGTVSSTDAGTMLHLTPALGKLALSNWAMKTTSNQAKVRANVTPKIPSWMTEAFVPLDLNAVGLGSLLGTFGSGKNQGSVTLTAIR